MSETYSHSGYSVTINQAGAIRVRTGDSLSKYSMAIHHDFEHINEFARIPKGQAKPVLISNLDSIRTGETIYHLPTRDGKMGPAKPVVFRPRIVAIATDKYLTPTTSFADTVNLGIVKPGYGQDITFASGRKAPEGHDVGSTVVVLKPKMKKLLDEFAAKDTSGMAKRLFNRFLAKQKSVEYFDDASLNKAASTHSNIEFFINAALNAPIAHRPTTGKTRIHQALKSAGWDIAKMTAPTDLGVPAFNQGSKILGTKDFGNGLGVMINGIQHAYVIATKYSYNKTSKTYDISLRYIFYDVFGLDDDDLKEFGAEKDGLLNTTAGVGITAWWQLQHQHNFAPLITRIIIDRNFTNIPAK